MEFKPKKINIKLPIVSYPTIRDMQGVIDRAKINAQIINSNKEFPVLIFTGISGCLITHETRKLISKDHSVVQVRKNFNHHSNEIDIVNPLFRRGEQYLFYFIDDFISSGGTLEKVCTKLSRSKQWSKLDSQVYKLRIDYILARGWENSFNSKEKWSEEAWSLIKNIKFVS